MLKTVLLVAGAVVLVAAGVMVARIGPRNVIGMLMYDRRREGDLKPGDQAPDVALVALDGASQVRMLSAARSRPLVLVFGSFT